MIHVIRATTKRFPQLHVLRLSIMCVADSHLHVWGDGKDPFSYAEGQDPPGRLQQSSGPETLLVEMDKAGVGGALIVQVWMDNQSKLLLKGPAPYIRRW